MVAIHVAICDLGTSGYKKAFHQLKTFNNEAHSFLFCALQLTENIKQSISPKSKIDPIFQPVPQHTHLFGQLKGGNQFLCC